MRQFLSDDDSCQCPTPILPSPCVTATFTMDIKERVRAATLDQPDPSLCPLHYLFVRSGEQLLWVPPQVQRPKREEESGVVVSPSLHGLTEPIILVPTPLMSGLCSQFPHQLFHRPLPIPVRLWLPPSDLPHSG